MGIGLGVESRQLVRTGGNERSDYTTVFTGEETDTSECDESRVRLAFLKFFFLESFIISLDTLQVSQPHWSDFLFKDKN